MQFDYGFNRWYFRIMTAKGKETTGFTLIELSIVLVIIGLLVGAVLVGRDLIAAAAIQQQIGQFQKIDEGVMTFRAKYLALPGDIPAETVAQLGFTGVPVRAGTIGQGDGDGLIEGICCGDTGGYIPGGLTNGESAWFWVDLTTNSHLIDGLFNTASSTPLVNGPTLYGTFSNPPLSLIIPPAKIAPNYLYIVTFKGANYYGISHVQQIDLSGGLEGDAGLTVIQASNIDTKLDDGAPQTGNIVARYADWNRHSGSYPDGLIWAAGGGAIGAADTSATVASSTTCYDNGGIAGNIQHYSLGTNEGNLNCGLLVKLQ